MVFRKTRKRGRAIRKGGAAAEPGRIRLNPDSVKATKKCHPEIEGDVAHPQSCLSANDVKTVAHHYNKNNRHMA